MTNLCRILSLFGVFLAVYGQNIEDDVHHFTNPAHGNAVWIIDDSSLPWKGGYKFLRSLTGAPTTLLSVVDSSTGVTLGQCIAPQDFNENHTKKWEDFQWKLTLAHLECTFGGSNSTLIPFNNGAGTPRTYSVRIQAATGPSCLRDLTVQDEQPTGCPPHLTRNSFSANAFNCSCPYLSSAMEDGESETEDIDMLANSPQFPLFKGIEQGSGVTKPWTLSPSPCAQHECLNNGTCLVSQEGTATCLCRNGFTGNQCELDVCSSVPCQNGGVCRSNAGIAYCDCAPNFTGLLCESGLEEGVRPTCNPECSNGECVEKNGIAQCECRQGFTGSNCNVLDVCLGDAACSMFGPNAKCVLDDNMDNFTSTILINGTYDCYCPHPINGQFVDCMQLHAPTTGVPTSGAPATFPVLEMSKIPIASSTSTPIMAPVSTNVQTEPVQTSRVTVTREPMRPIEITMSTTLPPPFSQHIITAGNVQTVPTTSQTQTTETFATAETSFATQSPTTFIFPNTPETTAIPSSNSPQTKFVQPMVPDNEDHREEEEEEEEEEDTEEQFPTPSTMNMIPVNFMTTTAQTTMSSTTVALETTTTEEEDEEEVEETETTNNGDMTTEVTDEPTEATTTTMEDTTTEEFEDESEESQTSTTAQTGLPFWMTSSTTSEIQEVTTMTPVVQPEVTTTEESKEAQPEEPTDGNAVLMPKNTVQVTTPDGVIHQHSSNGKQSSAAASWIIAIIALIVLGLLLLATSLFILRYIRQSRKLHGKYNPAREEHNLSAAYAMPMSHIAKEERLI
ncbi:unnamed protein product [Caenorhabditis bovis]|uniref:EGF-like domain-containing protein n=1 Tax=Caenorhabditis bovis TaxID=2654633 RepID=A0A8S1F336_9PELO|nr:unnamed protein product [Caenorhabditis bovis]